MKIVMANSECGCVLMTCFLESLIIRSSSSNAIKDASGASGPRASTSSNPLGLPGTRSSVSSKLSGALSSLSDTASRVTSSKPVSSVLKR